MRVCEVGIRILFVSQSDKFNHKNLASVCSDINIPIPEEPYLNHDDHGDVIKIIS